MHLRSESTGLKRSTGLGIVIAIALFVRAAIVFSSLQHFESDPDAYRAIAQSIAKHAVFGLYSEGLPSRPTAFRPPLYPFLLSFLTSEDSVSTLAVATFHTVLGVVTAVLVYLTVSRVTWNLADPGRIGDSQNSRVAIIAAILVIVDPILISHSRLVMTETLSAMLVALAVWWWIILVDQRKHVQSDRSSASAMHLVCLGLVLALAYLCRPTFLVWAGWIVIIAAYVVAKTRGSWKQGLIRAAVIALVVGLAVGAWMIRNIRVMGHPIWATSHGGYTFLLGNNESFFDYLHDGQWGTAWNATQFLDAYQHRYDGDPNEADFWHQDWSGPRKNRYPVAEHDDDKKSYDAALATIKRRPADFVWSCVVRVARLLSPIPHDVQGRSILKTTAVSIFYLLIYAAIVVAVFKHRRTMFSPLTLPMWALIVSLVMVHAFYWSNMRMRAPAIPVFAVLASFALMPSQTVNTETRNAIG